MACWLNPVRSFLFILGIVCDTAGMFEVEFDKRWSSLTWEVDLR